MCRENNTLDFFKQPSMLVFIALQIPGNGAFLIEQVKENIASNLCTQKLVLTHFLDQFTRKTVAF